jgi:AraC family transcriptional activator of pobA
LQYLCTMRDQGVFPIFYFHSCPPLKGFKAYKLERSMTASPDERRDLYRICLLTPKTIFRSTGDETEFEDSVLFFARPQDTSPLEIISQTQSGYRCLFTEDFLHSHPRLAIFLQSPLLGLRDSAVSPLDQTQKKRLSAIFEQILLVINSDYVFKRDLLGNYLHLLIHEALKRQFS